LFIRIDEAFKTLKEPSKRKEYDSKRFQQTARTQMIIHDTIRNTEFLYDESNKVHYHVCKCGGWYILEEEESEEEEDEYIICCDECSLVIKVINNKKIL
jgi:DnaJ-class molecular chaperone